MRRSIASRVGILVRVCIALAGIASLVVVTAHRPPEPAHAASETVVVLPEDDPKLEPSPDASPVASPDVEAADPVAEPVSAEEPQLVCRNSFDERCGDFYWDPDPGPNKPMTIEMTVFPEHPVAGEEVTITVTAIDPDARIDEIYIAFGDEKTYLIPPRRLVRRYGPWTPPAREYGSFTRTEKHVYDGGTFTVRTWAVSAFAMQSPYSSEAFGDLSISVEGNPSPEPSPSEAPSPASSASP